MNYKNKYLKYKLKYLELKKIGGSDEEDGLWSDEDEDTIHIRNIHPIQIEEEEGDKY